MAKDESAPAAELFPSTETASKAETATPDDGSASEKRDSDVESGKYETSGMDSETEKSNLVTWEGPDDPANPKNWSNSRKWTSAILISCFAFICPLSSSMAAPALNKIGDDLGIPENSLELQLVLSIFVLAYSFGPLVLSPCSEVWGRTRIIKFGNLLFIVFNTACGFAKTEAQITAFRLIAGFGGSATLGMGAGVISDCWNAEERGRGMSIYQLAPVLGPAVGPIAGGLIVSHTTWRWTFWTITIFNVAIQIGAAIFLKETYAPRLLLLKARKLRAETGNNQLQTKWEKDGRTLTKLVGKALTRPWRFLATQPIIQLLALYQAMNYGLLYLMIASFPSLWEGRYGMSTSIASLNYISLALGSLIGAQVCGPLIDATHRRLKKRHGLGPDEPGLPEFRIPIMIPAAIITPCGIFLYAWSAEYKVHWIVPNIGAVLFAGGSMVSYQCIQTYVVDCYTTHAASASAASAFLRSLAAFSFPLFAPYLVHNLGYGWGGSVLGFVAVVLGIPAPLLFWKYGKAIREFSFKYIGNDG
ncbi:uncharacterized protein K452DRAFT_319005 [Aplosporella prunicola CBS 121167]|uniref:Major facilitator superfamily (MFS) profile domain-containing protein n=1 Tax=Aplosporella prunicola CBS 121167 TaxID=1176127 RepID=A0A6A6BDK6_9PEZI|nr:uncharacterized protein K452DRAFT_319005 [Aplosporella prunicola CBS 121167]KAF2141375.1 hypothetical protein K452DRAFT_319005 [Aplosporella prunicola CBS 121167]